MRPRSLRLHACLAWLLAMLAAACHPSAGPVTPLVPPAPRAAAKPLPPPPPVSLTASDGTGLALASLRARAVIDDPLALTELELAFDNPRSETIEGRFELLLPPGARVTRFALEVGGQWREAEVVERLAARQAYEVSLYEGRDPALLERDSGNRFGARVFPIGPRERKRVLVSYVEEFADPAEPWRLSLRGLPGLASLELEARVVDSTGAARRLRRSLPAWQAPAADLVVPRDAPPTDGVRHGEQVVARIQPLAGVDLGEPAAMERLTVLVDTSASRALDFDASLAILGRTLEALARHAGTAELRVLAFDQEVVPIYAGSLVGFDADALAALHARRPLGASDLGLALRALEEGEHSRVLLVSDGLASVGEQSDAALRRQLQALAARGVERLDALVLGRVRDEQRLRRLVTGPLPRAGVVLHPEQPPERAALRLVQPTLEGVRLAVPGARWWSPTRLEGLQPDDHVLVYADLPEDQPLRVQVSGPVHRDVEVPLRTTESPLHEHGWRRAQIEGLVERLAVLQDELESERLRRHVIALSVRHRIVNDLTALLVLERDEDYARFGLDRRALEDVLVVGPEGAALSSRREPEPEPEPPPGDAVSEPAAEPEPSAARPGEIAGVVVHHATREPIARALVVLRCACLPAPRETTTDAHGGYAFEGLPAGRFTVQVLTGTADVTKTIEMPRGARPRLGFSVDPQREHRMMIQVQTKRSLRRAERRERHRGPGLGASSNDATAAPSPLAEPPASVVAPAPAQPFVHDVPALDPAKTPEPTADSAAGEPVDGEEHHDLPVGVDAGRDFAAAIDTTAAASRHVTGVSLASNTESGYELMGAAYSPISASREPVPARVALHRTSLTSSSPRTRPIRRRIRQQLDPVSVCYFRALARDPELRGRLVVRLELAEGRVIAVGKRAQKGLDDPELLRCLDGALRAWELPARVRRLTQTLVFLPNDGPPEWFWSVPAPELEPEHPTEGEAFSRVSEQLARGDRARALALARQWRERAPVDVLALVALGDAARVRGDRRHAARAYGSIIDLHPSRADMLRFAAALLESLDDPAALDVAIDAYRQAVAQRPDHPTGHRNLALALLRRGEPQAAFEVLERALGLPYPPDRFPGVQRVLQDDLGIAAAAWLHRDPTRASTIHARLAALGVPLASAPSLRMVLTWESDVSDVDLHVVDAEGNHASPDSSGLPSGGAFVADVSTGFGPESFVVPGTPARGGYGLRVHYYARGPMGYGMGKVAVLHHDGAGGLRFEDRPFVVTEDGQWVDLGTLAPSAPAPRAPALALH